MRDSRHGTFGVVAIVLSVALRAAALAQAGEAIYAGLALIAAHAGSRALLPAAMWALTAGRAPTGSALEAGRPRSVPAIAAVLIGVVVALAALGPWLGLIAFVVAAVAWRPRGCSPGAGSAATPAMFWAPFSRSAEIAMLLAAAAR